MKQANSHTKYIKLFWVGMISIFLIPVLLVACAASGLFGELPKFEELENPKSNLAAEVYSSDQEIIGKYYIENRTNISFEKISPNVINALIATEDARFYNHSGVDIRALARVIKGVVTGNENQGGGSTISQQLAKMLFHDRPSSKLERVTQKIKEWIIAAKLEKHYTKEEILSMYLNRFDFVNNAVGIKSASHIYFNRSPDSLSITEAALLVGMAKNPALFNPLRRPDTTLQRRNVVLYQMTRYKNPATKEKYLTREQYDSLKTLPLGLRYTKEDHNEGIATYFREYLRGELLKWCKENKKPDGSSYNLYKDGLKIYTTINSKMQKYAEQAVEEHIGGELQPEFFKQWKGKKNAPFNELTEQQIENLMEQSMKRSERYAHLKAQKLSSSQIKKVFHTPTEMTVFSWKGEIDTVLTPMDSIRYAKHFLRSGLMAMDPSTGYIKAWVGGINYRHFKYDQVKQGRRQVGSTFKPFVYALAMQEGWSPCYEVPNVPVTFELETGETWTPKNSDAEYGGMTTLKRGLALSINTITAYIMKQFGPQAVVDLIKKMGITSPVEAVPSICLGTPDISLYEMVGANATFANKGVWTEPIYISRIEDKNGNILQEFTPKREEAMSEEAAYLTLNLMKGVVEHGTGVRLRYRYKLEPPIAGKTGTTQNNSDGWFMGLTPELVSGVWVGGEDRSIHFRTTQWGQGATMALPVWAKFMQKVYDDSTLTISKGDFERPRTPINVEVDCSKYKSESKETNFSNDNPFDR